MLDLKEKWYYEFTQLSSISPNGQFTIKVGEVGTPIAILPVPIGRKDGKEQQEQVAKFITASPELFKQLNKLFAASTLLAPLIGAKKVDKVYNIDEEFKEAQKVMEHARNEVFELLKTIDIKK